MDMIKNYEHKVMNESNSGSVNERFFIYWGELRGLFKQNFVLKIPREGVSNKKFHLKNSDRAHFNQNPYWNI